MLFNWKKVASKDSDLLQFSKFSDKKNVQTAHLSRADAEAVM